MNYILIIFCASWKFFNHCKCINANANVAMHSGILEFYLFWIHVILVSWKMLSIQSVLHSYQFSNIFLFQIKCCYQVWIKFFNSQRWFVWLKAKQTTKLCCEVCVGYVEQYLLMLWLVCRPCLGKRTPPTDRWRADFWKYKWSQPPANYLWKTIDLSRSFTTIKPNQTSLLFVCGTSYILERIWGNSTKVQKGKT